MRSIPLRARSRRMIIGFGAVGGLAVCLSSCASTGHPAATGGGHSTATAGSHATTTSTPPGTATSSAPPSQNPPPPPPLRREPVPLSLAPGDYLNASGAVPHYQVAIAASAPGTLQGTLTFVFQDGKQSQVFTFTASPGTSAGSAPFPLVTSPGAAHATATIMAGTFTLPGCQSYLMYAFRSAPAGVFTAAGG